MTIHSCPYCQCGSCKSHQQGATTVGNIDKKDWFSVEDLPKEDKVIWEKGQPNYPGSYEGFQVMSHVTQNGNSQTHYVDRSLPPQNIQGFQQTYHRDPNQQWERMPNSPLPEEMQRQVNQQMHGLAENLGRQYGAQNVQVHQAFLTPDLIRQLPPEQQRQIRQYQQQVNQVGIAPTQSQPQIQQQPKQGFWDRLKNGTRQLNQPHSLTPQQKQQIINFCKRNNKEEIGGIITSDGRVVQLPNQARDKRNHFQFRWNGQDAVAIWHQHVRDLGHAPELSPDDIRAAQQSGLSMYMVFNPTWEFREYHPNRQPNTTPIRNYSVSFTCPTAQQITQKQKEAVQWIQEDNQRYRKAADSAVKEIQTKQREVMAVATKALTTSTTAQDKSQAIALRLNLAKQQPKLLPPGQGDKVNGNIWMGQKQPEQQQLHAGQRSNSDVGNKHRVNCLPVGRGVAAKSGTHQRAYAESRMDGEIR